MRLQTRPVDRSLGTPRCFSLCPGCLLLQRRPLARPGEGGCRKTVFGVSAFFSESRLSGLGSREKSGRQLSQGGQGDQGERFWGVPYPVSGLLATVTVLTAKLPAGVSKGLGRWGLVVELSAFFGTRRQTWRARGKTRKISPGDRREGTPNQERIFLSKIWRGGKHTRPPGWFRAATNSPAR